jgi:hypothetical protein
MINAAVKSPTTSPPNRHPNDLKLRSTQKIPVFTVGFTKKTAGEFFKKLPGVGIKRMMDGILVKQARLQGAPA